METRIYSTNEKLRAINELAEIIGLTNEEKIAMVNKVIAHTGIQIEGDMKGYCTYDKLREVPPISELEFEKILEHRGLITMDYNDYIRSVRDNTSHYFRVMDKRLHFNERNFNELLKEIGLITNTLF